MALAPVPYHPPPTVPSTRHRARRRALLALYLLGIGVLTGLTASPRGWAAIGLAWLMLALLGAHRAAGGRRVARMVCEYAVVATMTVLVVTTLSPTAASAPARPQVRVTERSTLIESVADARARLTGVWQQLSQQANQPAEQVP